MSGLLSGGQAFDFEPVSRPVPVILDTDMATDCDDAGAMAVLHALASKGQASILAVVGDNKDGASIGAVAAINAFYGRPDIPLGAYQDEKVGADAGAFIRDLASDKSSYGHTISSKKEVPPAVDIYRKMLAQAADSTVVIISIGHLNNLSDLLESKADQYSPLDGKELVRQKTAYLVVMGGDYPAGKEHNFFARGSAPFSVKAVDNWPTPVLFSGFTLGERVMTGPGLSSLPDNHPVKRAYAGHSSNPLVKGRPSWDQTAVVAAVLGPRSFWELSKPGWNKIAEDGSNRWEENAAGTHFYLIERKPVKKVADEIEDLMKRKKD